MFGIALSGLSASQTYLDTTSNNIANVNTYGFKSSRAEFADVYSNSVFTSSATSTGLGTLTTTVSQQFTQGTLTGDTGNNLDMAISGNGFFVLSNESNEAGEINTGSRTYTRNGAFELDSEGYIVTATGEYLLGYYVDDEGNVTNLDLNSCTAIQVPSTTGAPKASSEISIGLTLPADEEDLGSDTENALENFDPSDSSTYTCSTSQTIHDSLGGTHTVTYYFIKNNTVDDTTSEDYGTTTWYLTVFVDGNPVDLANSDFCTVTDANSSTYGETYSYVTLVFGSDGLLTEDGIDPSALYICNLDNGDNTVTEGREAYSLAAAMGGGVDDSQNVNINLSLCQYSSTSFTISESPSDDGYSTGELTNVEVTEEGLIVASYSNGRTEYIAMVALANFVNVQGLTKVGDTQWAESVDSGEAIAMMATVGTAGTIKGSNLEESNVDLSEELVDLIVAQRAYQANCQALQTQNTVMDSILSIR